MRHIVEIDVKSAGGVGGGGTGGGVGGAERNGGRGGREGTAEERKRGEVK